MSADARAVVEEAYRAVNEGRPQDFTDFFHPDAEWRWPPRGLADTDVYRGEGEIMRGMVAWRDAWGEFRFEPEEFLEDDPYVLVLVGYRTTGRQSGLALQQTVAHLWRARDGLVDRLGCSATPTRPAAASWPATGRVSAG